MSGFSSPEFLLIVVLALVVLGPKRLPEIANKIGGWVGQARRMTRMMRRQLEEELQIDDLNQIASPDFGKPPTTPAAPPAEATTAAATAKAATAETAAAAETDVAAAAETPVEAAPDHIPNDDDTYSPLHGDKDVEKSA